jgi:hypothetical protein
MQELHVRFRGPAAPNVGKLRDSRIDRLDSRIF